MLSWCTAWPHCGGRGAAAHFATARPPAVRLGAPRTGDIGSDEHNQRLSELRAMAVTEALVRDGVNASRITTRGYGAANPVASNATAEGRAQNRRVEIFLE